MRSVMPETLYALLIQRQQPILLVLEQLTLSETNPLGIVECAEVFALAMNIMRAGGRVQIHVMKILVEEERSDGCGQCERDLGEKDWDVISRFMDGVLFQLTLPEEKVLVETLSSARKDGRLDACTFAGWEMSFPETSEGLGDALEAVKDKTIKRMVRRALLLENGNIEKTALRLKILPDELRRYLEMYKIENPPCLPGTE